MSNEEKDFLTVALTFGAVGFLARAVRYAREHGQEELNLAKFCTCTISAALISVLAGWALDGFGVNRELTLAAVGAIGYVGGPCLDLLYDETLKLSRRLLEIIEKQLE